MSTLKSIQHSTKILLGHKRKHLCYGYEKVLSSENHTPEPWTHLG